MVDLAESGTGPSPDDARRSASEAEINPTNRRDPGGWFGVDNAVDVAERLMHPEDSTAAGAGKLEPDSPQAARIAVEHLDKRLRELPSFIRKSLAGAERNADRLSDDKLQGLAELIQNADDVAASSVTFSLQRVYSGARPAGFGPDTFSPIGMAPEPSSQLCTTARRCVCAT